MENKKIVYGVIGIIFCITIVSAFNMSIDAKDYELCFFSANGSLIGCYDNETIDIGINDYVIQLEERKFSENLTTKEILYYPLNIVTEHKTELVLMIVVFLMFSVMLIFYKVWT